MFGRDGGQCDPRWSTARQAGMDVAGSLPALLVRSAVQHALAAPAAMTALDGTGRQVLHTRTYLICCSGVAIGILAAVCRWAPRAWQRLTTATGRRSVAFLCVSLCAAAIGLMFPRSVMHATGTMISLIAAVGGFRLWNLWRKRWCGAGENPNLLTGLIRPPIRAGQLWWTVPSRDDGHSGLRAVLVIGRHPGGSWDVAPVTFEDQSACPSGQIHMSPQRIRQLTSAGWLNLTDRTLIGRDQLGSYIGKTPYSFHREVCAHVGGLPDPLPWTPDRAAHNGETSAGPHGAADAATPWWLRLEPTSPSQPWMRRETVTLPRSLPGDDAGPRGPV